LNKVFKDFIDHKELPLDMLLVALDQLSTYYYNEIKRGFNNEGNFRLADQFSSYRTNNEFLDLKEQINPK